MSGTSLYCVTFCLTIGSVYWQTALLKKKKKKLAPLVYVLNAFLVVACNNVKYSVYFLLSYLLCTRQMNWSFNHLLYYWVMLHHPNRNTSSESVSPVKYWFPIISAALKTSPVLGLRFPFRDVQRTPWPTWENRLGHRPGA